MFVQRHQDSCLVSRDNSGFPSSLGSAIGSLLEVRQETQGPFSVATGILGFLSIFKRSQVSSHFEALNSVCFSNCQRDVRSLVEMIRVTRSFSRVSTRDSDIPSSWEMLDQPAFKSLQGNPALFFSQGISMSILLEAANSGSLSHTCS